MDIRLVEKSGVPASEIEAHQRIQKAFDAAAFSKGWRGYASFKLGRGGAGAGDDDFDLILVTHTNIIVIELKNWRGGLLESRAGNWYVDGDARGRSPVPLVNLKAKRLGSALQRKLGANKTPLVLSFVVLSESLKSLELDEDEAASVLYLSELMAWTVESKYRRLIHRTPRFNPLQYLVDYDGFFEGQSGRPKGYSFHGFQPDRQPMWEHPTKLYAEYRSKEKSDPLKLALLREWDFGAMGTQLIGEGERGFIGLREQRVYEYVEGRNDELARSLLRPIVRQSESDVTRDFKELYVLPPKVMRLSEFANAVLPKMAPAERVILLKSMLLRFADLHDLNVAHRDIGAHCLWVERPAKVYVTGFPAAYYPSMVTIGAFREKVKGDRSSLPEDLGLAAEGTPYHRDVYMLGVLAHLVLYGERPPKVDGVFAWEPRARDDYDGAFDAPLLMALATDPLSRFDNARLLLESINSASSSAREQVIDLSVFDAHRANSKARDYPEESAPLTDDDDLLSYRSHIEGQPVLVKEWHAVEPDARRPDQAIRLLSFLERARNLKTADLPGMPRFHDYGLSRRSLLLVQHWVDGDTLTHWLTKEQSRDERLNLARSLTKILARMHGFEWAHGDVKPDNIVVQPDGEPVFVDVLDFRRGSDDAYSTAYLPADYKTMSPMARDRYGLAAVLKEILLDEREPIDRLGVGSVIEEVDRLLNDRTASGLEPLQSALEGKSQRADSTEVERIRVRIRNLGATGVSAGTLVSDNGFFYLSMEDSRNSPGSKQVHLTGAGARLTIEWPVAPGRYLWAAVKPVDLSQLVRAQERCLRRVQLNIDLADGVHNDVTELEPSLDLWLETFATPSETEQIDTEAPKAQLDIDSDAPEVTEASEAPIQTPAAEFDVQTLWRLLLDAEEDILPIANVLGEGRRNPERRHQMLLPCTLSGAGFDPDPDDRTWVERVLPDGTWRRCGDLELRDTQFGEITELAVERWIGKPAKPGDRLRLRSNMESTSFNRRAEAVERILDGRAAIPNLVEYFQSEAEQPPPMTFNVPTDEAVSAYSQGSKRLNESQREAFRKAVQFGPVSLLQGPPGTGKTWFIASLLHYLVTKERARRVLVVSQAHEAVNNALEKAMELFESKGIPFDAVRLGNEKSISDTVRHLHSSSIEQVYRERFKAEYKERVVRLASDMGLPVAFTQDAVRLHTSVGRLAEQVGLLEQELGEPQKGDTGEPDASSQRLNHMRETLRDICLRDYAFELGDTPLAMAVDELFSRMAELHEIQSPQSLDKIRKLLKLSDDWLKTLGEPAANFVEFLAKSRTVVAGTLVGIGRRASGVVHTMYDWVIIDEAGRAAPSELAVALQTGRRILLVGDHKQLPPSIEPEVKFLVSKKLGVNSESNAFASDFERMFDSGYGKGVGASLKEQYRMAPAIGELVSEVFYDAKLATGRGASWLDPYLLPPQLKHEVTWVDTSGLGKRAFESTSADRVDSWNEAEGEVVMGVLKRLLDNRDLVKSLKDGLHADEPIVGIICMYSRQRDLLNRKKGEARWIPAELRRLIKVDTVDSYQGKENRVVILSTVRNNPQQNPGFLRSPNRINVAMSRAMERLVIVGSASMWRGKNQELPLGLVLSKVESLAIESRAAVVRAQEFLA